MSGVPPYVYLDIGTGDLTALGPDILQYLYDNFNLGMIIIEGIDFFEPGCFTAQFNDDTVASEHPLNSYNIRYPYCRTALQYNMSDGQADPQIGQIIIQAPILSIKLILVGCDTSPIISITSKLEPSVTKPCAVELYPGNTLNEIFLIAEAASLTLPARITFTATNSNGVQRTFWVGLRDSRSGKSSGAVI